MMHVHGLDSDTTGTRHPGKTHVRAAEEATAKALKLDIHLDRGIFVEEGAGLNHDAFTGSQAAFKDVAVAVQDEKAGSAGGNEAIHIHALTAEENVGETFDAHEGIVDLMG